MAYDPRTGIQSFAQADPSADVNAAIDVPEAVAPSTATALAPRWAPTPGGRTASGISFDPFQDAWMQSMTWAGEGLGDQTMTWGVPSNMMYLVEGLDPYASISRPGGKALYAAQQGGVDEFWNQIDGMPLYGYVGEDLIRGPLDQLASAVGAEGVDWEPYLQEYWMNEWLDQLNNQRTPEHIFSYRQGYGDILSGVGDIASQRLDLPQLGDLVAQNVGPGTDFYGQYNELPNWIESQRDKARNQKAVATMAPIFTGLLAPYIVPTVSTAAGGGAMGAIAGGAAMGGLQGLATGDPVGGALRGGVSAGLTNVAAPAAAEYFGGADGMLERLGFSGDAAFADAADATRRAGTATALYSQPAQTTEPLFGGGSFSQPAMTTMQDPGALLTSGMLPATVATQNLFPGATGSVDTPRPEVEIEEPSLMDRAGRYLKLGQALASLGGGGSAPQDAPQREEGQSDSDYVQSLADYARVNVDARALAEMGLTPGTPQYYEYLMGQLDNTLADFEDAEDLMGQLRGKTQDELTSLRRALFVRGQLEQLMGSGTYTDPFSGLAEEVIDAGGTGINPAMAAYQRGLGRSIEGFAGLDPTARREEISGFLDRTPDLYGAQGRMDARSEQEAMVQAFIEDLKRRQGGMLRGAPQFWE